MHRRGQEVPIRAAQLEQSEPGLVRPSEGVHAYRVPRPAARRLLGVPFDCRGWTWP